MWVWFVHPPVRQCTELDRLTNKGIWVGLALLDSARLSRKNSRNGRYVRFSNRTHPADLCALAGSSFLNGLEELADWLLQGRDCSHMLIVQLFVLIININIEFLFHCWLENAFIRLFAPEMFKYTGFYSIYYFCFTSLFTHLFVVHCLDICFLYW